MKMNIAPPKKVSLSDIMKKAWKLARKAANKFRAAISYQKRNTVKAAHYISWALKEAWKLAKEFA